MSNIVVSPHSLSTLAGINILRNGGNAIDAAIATNIVQGVVAPETCGIGGDLFALIWINGETQPYCLDSSGYAGSNVDLLSLSSYASIPLDHPMSVTVPGAVRGWFAMHERFGSLKMKDLFNQAIEICSKGFDVSSELHQSLKSHEETLKIQDSGKELYPSGKVPNIGDTVQRFMLGKTLKSISDQGSDYFYSGNVSNAISDSLSNIVTSEDISSFHPQWIEPLSIEIYGKIGWVTPPHTQSYLTLATLKIYEMLDSGSNDIDLHTLIESYRAAASQRDDITYDYENIDLFPGLDTEYLKSLSNLIDLDNSSIFNQPTDIGGGTAYMCTKDKAGNAVSLIQSNYYGIGSTIGVKDYGFFLHNRGAGFNLIKNHPNSLKPGRKPLHTLSPTMWSVDGNLDMVIGTRGGRYQPQLLSHFILKILKNENLKNAMISPRWNIDEFGKESASEINIEPGLDGKITDELVNKGHKVNQLGELQNSYGPISAIVKTDDSWNATHDPRVDTASSIID
jgi:gamma-glutamyltranspeptidase/glutathione hydrolase